MRNCESETARQKPTRIRNCESETADQKRGRGGGGAVTCKWPQKLLFRNAVGGGGWGGGQSRAGGQPMSEPAFQKRAGVGVGGGGAGVGRWGGVRAGGQPMSETAFQKRGGGSRVQVASPCQKLLCPVAEAAICKFPNQP